MELNTSMERRKSIIIKIEQEKKLERRKWLNEWLVVFQFLWMKQSSIEWKKKPFLLYIT